MSGRKVLYYAVGGTAALGVGTFIIISAFFLPVFPVRFEAAMVAVETVAKEPAPPVFVATHIKTPPNVRAIYMSSFVAGDKVWRENLVRLIEETELNALVIDIKDYSGLVAFPVESSALEGLISVDARIPDIENFLADLHRRGIYAIGRISAFQDPALVGKRFDLAVKRESDKTKIWKDYKGQTWVDPGSREVWEYLSMLALAAYAKGFDEINFDYIRFPSDGNMKDIYYPESEGKNRAEVIAQFFTHLNQTLREKGVLISADLFGMTTTNKDDLNIGQVLEKALAHFDYVAPMVYPSHYPPNLIGLSNPAEKPYEVVRYSMDKAFERSSTTPWKLRPWLQDFNLGATYTATMVRRQIEAVYDSNVHSWMLWNASNKYTKEALLKE